MSNSDRIFFLQEARKARLATIARLYGVETYDALIELEVAKAQLENLNTDLELQGRFF